MTDRTRATLLLEVVPADGLAAWTDPWAGSGLRTLQATPPSTFGDYADGLQPITIGHDGPPIGALDYLEWDCGYGNGGMYAVGVVDDIDAEDIDNLLMCSAEIRANGYARTVPTTIWSDTGQMRSSAKLVGNINATRATLHGVGLVGKTASVTSTMVRAWPGDYRDSFDRGRWRSVPSIIDRAVAAAGWELRYRRPSTMKIHHPYHGIERRHDELRHGGAEIFHTAPYAGVLSVRTRGRQTTS